MDATHLLDRLRAISTTSLCDADPTAQIPVGLICINPGPRVAGPARTVFADGDLLPVLRGLESLQASEVLVIDTGEAALAIAGELFATHAQNAGAAAMIVDGFVRDVDTLRTLTMPVYARGVVPRACPARTWGDLQAPVDCGGARVAAGDFVVADADGIVVMSAEQAAAAIPRAEQIEQTEAQIRAALNAGRSLFTMVNFDEVSAAQQHGAAAPLQLRPPSD